MAERPAESMARRLEIQAGQLRLEVELRDTPTARALLEAVSCRTSVPWRRCATGTT